MPVTIPLRTDLPHYAMQVTLDELPLTLEFRWNTRESCWYMSCLNDDESEYYFVNSKVLPDWPIGRRRARVRKELGLFMAVDLNGEGIGPGVDELGGRIELVYYSRDELAALAAES